MADPSKTEKATPRKQQEARKKGNVAKSTEINTAITLLVALILFKNGGQYLYKFLSFTTKSYFTRIHEIKINLNNIGSIMMDMLIAILIVIVPIMIIFMTAAIIANLIQVGFLLSLEPIRPKLSKINPIKGAQNLFSKNSLATLFKSLAKVGVIGYLAYSTIRDKMPLIRSFFFQGIEANLLGVGSIAMSILTKIVIAFVVIASIDYVFQRYNRAQQMKMSKQEIKDEHKKTEGDPQIKGAIKRRQMEMAKRRMISDVPQADVVITNPTHVAVAVQYDAKSMGAPKVVAKGMNKIAERIKEIAAENNVPIVENPPVARALFKACEIDKEIPGDLYTAVAEVLTYVYKLSGKTFGI